jgi:pimeloyl-ACP methyl ester carboxylesterase
MDTPLPAYYSVGAGPAVVLLHCSLSSRNEWRSLTAMLSDRYRVIAVDLYGYGDTPMPADRQHFSLRDEAALVDSLLDRIVGQDEPLHLVGHSYGGAVALRYCHDHPGRVTTLTAFEPVAFFLLEPGEPALAEVREMDNTLVRLVAAGLPLQAVRTFIDYWGGEGAFDRFPERMRNDLMSRVDKLLLDFEALTRADLSAADLGKLTLPVTLIAGRSSRLPPLRVIEKLAELLPACRVCVVESGHMAPLTDPELVYPIIKEALSR